MFHFECTINLCLTGRLVHRLFDKENPAVQRYLKENQKSATPQMEGLDVVTTLFVETTPGGGKVITASYDHVLRVYDVITGNSVVPICS